MRPKLHHAPQSMDIKMSDLYINIKNRRLELRMSQEQLAKKMGYTSRSTIAKIESGRNDIPQSKIKAFAEALETTPSALLGLTDDNHPEADSLSKKIYELAVKLNSSNKQRVIKYMERLISESSKESAQTVALSIAARGPQDGKHTLTQEEYIDAETTHFDEITPRKNLPEF